MAVYKDKFAVYRAGELLPTFFGDPTIIATAVPLQLSHVGEYFILHKHDGKPQFSRGVVDIKVPDVNPEVLPWKLEHTLEEAYHFALTGYREYIEKIYPQANDLNLFHPPYHMISCEKEHLARLWMRNEYHDEISKTFKASRSDYLRSFLDEISHLPAITVTRE